MLDESVFIEFQVGSRDLLEASTGFVDLIKPIGGHVSELLAKVFGDVQLVEQVLDVTFIIGVVALVGQFTIHEAVDAIRDLVHELLLFGEGVVEDALSLLELFE